MFVLFFKDAGLRCRQKMCWFFFFFTTEGNAWPDNTHRQTPENLRDSLTDWVYVCGKSVSVSV